MSSIALRRAETAAKKSAGSRWPLAVIGTGLSLSALWTLFLGYGIYHVICGLLN